ncbi:hypothetical protein SDC9_140048 [bioreactor metagenome]|uniref:Uncharacterized protein n=1 Tax=bioreactor metagenome TaxID=1076179 RepID=A0A645DX49_9ZZZZ
MFCPSTYLSILILKLYLSESELATDLKVRFPFVLNPTFFMATPLIVIFALLYSSFVGLASILSQSFCATSILMSITLSFLNIESYSAVFCDDVVLKVTSLLDVYILYPAVVTVINANKLAAIIFSVLLFIFILLY